MILEAVGSKNKSWDKSNEYQESPAGQCVKQGGLGLSVLPCSSDFCFGFLIRWDPEQ